MSEYIITTEQIEEAAEYTPAFKTLSYVAKYKISGDLDMEGIVVHSLPEIVRCRDCKHANMTIDVCYRSGDIGDDLYYPEIDPYGFCAWGERRNQ